MSGSRCPSRDRLEAQATVRNANQDWLELELDSPARCAGCSGLCLWSLNRRPTRIRVLNRRQQLSVGDRLSLSVSPAVLLKAALLAYGLPLLSMIGGAVVLGSSGSDVAAVVGAVLGLGAGLPLAARLQGALLSRLTGELLDHKPISF